MTSFSIEKSFNKARQLMKRGEVQDAISIYQRVLEKYPQNQRASQALQNIFETGVGAAARRPPEETIRALTQNINAKKFNVVLAKAEELVKSYPSSAELWSAIGIASTQIDNQDAAINAFKKVISLNPKLPEAHNNLANAYKELGEFSLSETHYRIAINQRPDFVQARHHLGQVLVDLGKIEEAKNELEAVLEISPDHGDVYRILSSICKHEAEDVRVQRVAHLLDQNRLSEENKYHLHFTMAKMQEDIGDIASAFHHYVAGGAIRKKLLKYKPEKDTKLFASIKKTGATLQSIKLDIPSTKKGVRPIFIIGMPRSGTTLIEQILSRHSDVQAGGDRQATP